MVFSRWFHCTLFIAVSFLSAAFLCWNFLRVWRIYTQKCICLHVLWRQHAVDGSDFSWIFFFFTFCVGVSILLMGDDAGIDFRRRTKLNRWQNQAIIQHKYIHLKRPGGAKWKLFIHNKWNTVHSRDVSVYSAKLYWIAMKENHCRGYLR